MERINRAIDWAKVEERVRDYYEIGRREEGADAYSPLMLLKALLLQKWFHIPSDPELENQINDRWFFKKFLGLPLDASSPDPYVRQPVVIRINLSKSSMPIRVISVNRIVAF